MKRNLVVCLLLLLTIFFATGCPTAKQTKEPANNNEPANVKKTSDVTPAVATDVATEQVSVSGLTVEYKDATYPFRFKIPVGWQYMEKYKNSVVTAIGPVDAQGYFPSVNVLVEKANPGILSTSRENFETTMKRQFPGYNLFTFETIKFGKYDALNIKATFMPAPDISMTQEQLIFNAGEFAYAITCLEVSTHYQDYVKTFESILTSFEFE